MAQAPGAEAVYQVADLFRQRCLVDGVSLLWPDQPVWTVENLDRFWDLVQTSQANNAPQNRQTILTVIENESPDLHRITADLMLLYCLYPSSLTNTKLEQVESVRSLYNLNAPDPDTWQLVERAFTSHAHGGSNYHRGTQYADVITYILLAKQCRSENINPYDPQAFRVLADKVIDSDEIGHSMRWTLPRHAILHLLFPKTFIGVVNKQHRGWILNQFSNEAGVPQGTDEDAALNMILKHLSNEYAVEPFDFYDDTIRPLWFRGRTSRTKDEQEIAVEMDDPMPLIDSPYQALIDATYLSSDTLQKIDEMLQDKRQMIFEGPPGSGKTFVAEKFARWFTGQSLDDTVELNEQVEIVQFHQSYGYEDFVQGIRPTTNDSGQLVYEVKSGIFLDMCRLASLNSNKDKRFVLIIDGINRGNLSRIFGELLLLLEYRDKTVRLPYGDNATLTIPKNLYIIGTMNTADRSLAQVDYALRRRFYFERFMPVADKRAGVFESWLETKGFDFADQSRLSKLFISLNEGIQGHLKTDDLQVGHSYFMTDDIATEVGFNRVWTRAVSPLLKEYFLHHRDRDKILEELAPHNLVPPVVETVPETPITMDEPSDDSSQDQ